MKFKYYIVDTNFGTIHGSNNKEHAEDFSQSEDYFVIDAENAIWMDENNGNSDIKEFEENS